MQSLMFEAFERLWTRVHCWSMYIASYAHTSPYHLPKTDTVQSMFDGAAAHHVADVDPDACEEGAEHVVADGQHEGQVLVGRQERAQDQHLHCHQAVQARHHCR